MMMNTKEDKVPENQKSPRNELASNLKIYEDKLTKCRNLRNNSNININSKLEGVFTKNKLQSESTNLGGHHHPLVVDEIKPYTTTSNVDITRSLAEHENRSKFSKGGANKTNIHSVSTQNIGGNFNVSSQQEISDFNKVQSIDLCQDEEELTNGDTIKIEQNDSKTGKPFPSKHHFFVGNSNLGNSKGNRGERENIKDADK